jgi:putative flippase GtrA
VPTAAPLSNLRNTRVGRNLRELTAFGVVGAVCFLIDVAVFQLLYAHVGLDAVVTKFVATTVSMTAAFVGHRFWSFSRRARTGLRREYLRFTSINGITLLLGLAIVGFVRYPLGQESALVLQAANVLSICVGTVVRYLAYSQWVFPASALTGVQPAAVRQLDPDTGPQAAGSLS